MKTIKKEKRIEEKEEKRKKKRTNRIEETNWEKKSE